MFETAENRDSACAAESPDSAAIYSTKKPLNNGVTGFFFTFLSVEPAVKCTPLRCLEITGISGG